MVQLPIFSDNDPDERYWDKAVGREVRRLRQGALLVLDNDDVISTLLGSCVAVCMRDRASGIGGMIHYTLPEPGQTFGGFAHVEPRACGKGSYFYGCDALPALYETLLRSGAFPANLEAKVFGGGEVVSGLNDVGGCNVDFALAFLKDQRITVPAKDIGGSKSRRIYFQPQTGRVWVRRLASKSPALTPQWGGGNPR